MTLTEKISIFDKRVSLRLARWTENHQKLVSFFALSGNAQPWFIVSFILLVFDVFMSRVENLIQLTIVGVVAICTTAIKYTFKRPRPCEDIPRKYVGKGDHWSFPSGHAGRMGSFAFLMSCYFPALSWLFIIWAIIVCYTRIALRVHYFLDVLAGVIIGVSVAGVGYYFFPQLSQIYQPLVAFFDKIFF